MLAAVHGTDAALRFAPLNLFKDVGVYFQYLTPFNIAEELSFYGFSQCNYMAFKNSRIRLLTPLSNAPK